MDTRPSAIKRLAWGLFMLLALGTTVATAQGPAATPTAGGTGAAGWQIMRVDAPHQFTGMRDRSLALDAAGRPHIAYGGDFLYDASYDGSAWHIEVVDPSRNVGLDASLALDALDRPHISYLDYTHWDLKYTAFDGAAWRIETVDDNGNVGEYNSLALDAQGWPRISYYDETLGDLKYACRGVCFPVAQVFLPFVVGSSGYLRGP